MKISDFGAFQQTSKIEFIFAQNILILFANAQVLSRFREACLPHRCEPGMIPAKRTDQRSEKVPIPTYGIPPIRAPKGIAKTSVRAISCIDHWSS